MATFFSTCADKLLSFPESPPQSDDVRSKAFRHSHFSDPSYATQQAADSKDSKDRKDGKDSKNTSTKTRFGENPCTTRPPGTKTTVTQSAHLAFFLPQYTTQRLKTECRANGCTQVKRFPPEWTQQKWRDHVKVYHHDLAEGNHVTSFVLDLFAFP